MQISPIQNAATSPPRLKAVLRANNRPVNAICCGGGEGFELAMI
jgi:hypothetical protein